MFLDSEIVTNHSRGNHGLLERHPMFFLKTPNRIELFEEPTLFLNQQFVLSGSARSWHTWAAAVQALKGWFEFLQAIKVDWRDASRDTRIEYKIAYESAISPQTGEKYQPETIANRMIIIRDFYRYAEYKDWYYGNLGNVEQYNSHKVINQQPIDGDFFAHIKNSGPRINIRDRDLPKRIKRNLIHTISHTDLKTMLHFAGPMASKRENDLRPARSRLFIDLAIHTCARLNELNSLTTLHFLGLNVGSQEQFIDFPLEIIGKGGKKRLLTCPGWLVRDAQTYIDDERAKAVKFGKIELRNDSKKLFVASITSSRSGKPITNRALEQELQQICLEAGLVEYKEKINVETGEKSIVKVAKHSPHDLRHTGIVLIYYTERMRGNTAPWKKCQAKAGHSSLKTTIDTYLSHVETWDKSSGNSIDILDAVGVSR